MQTTLRIDDKLYREAKAEAAREGVTLTRFLEEGLRLRLEKKGTIAAGEHDFRVFSKLSSSNRSGDEIKRVAEEEEEAGDLAKLGLSGSTR